MIESLKKWDEKKAKAILIDHLLNNRDRGIVCSEVPFLGGRRWADILEVKENSLIAYEIKSDLDSLYRIKGQIHDYLNTFNEVYIVLSKKFKGKEKELPKSVGYFWIDPSEEKVILKRKSQKRTRPSKKNLSYFLWREDISYNLKIKNKNINQARDIIENKSKTVELQKLVIKSLERRYRHRFDLFMKERGKRTHFSDVGILTKREISIEKNEV